MARWFTGFATDGIWSIKVYEHIEAKIHFKNKHIQRICPV